MGLPISISTPLETVRIAKQRRRRSTGYATAMYRPTVLSYRSQGTGAALAWLIMRATSCLTARTGWPQEGIRPFALTSTSVLRMTDCTQRRPSPPASLSDQWAALLLR